MSSENWQTSDDVRGENGEQDQVDNGSAPSSAFNGTTGGEPDTTPDADLSDASSAPDTVDAETTDDTTTETGRRPKRRAPLAVAGVVALALLAGGTAGYTAGGMQAGSQQTITGTGTVDTATGTTPKSEAVPASALSKVIAAKIPSVVTIGVTSPQQSGTGSGVVIDNAGNIATNAHVVTIGGATNNATLSVETNTGETYPAKLVGYDATADVAVINVGSAAKLQPITFADSSQLQVGDAAIAIGSPLGLSETVTSGIVSALNRPISVQSAAVGGSNTDQYGNQSANTVALSAIQTDAAINEGNSGGALLDANGNLLGLNESIATSETSTGSIGIGFAIPSNYVKRIANEIITTGKGSHGLLGASLSSYTPNDSTTFTAGAEIQALTSGGPAAEAGLRRGDVIIRAGNVTIASSTQLTALIKQEKPGTKLSLTYERDGKRATTTVTLDAAS